MYDIDEFVDAQRQSGLKAATVKRRVAALKTFFDFLAEESGDLSWPNPVRFKRHAGKQPNTLPRDLKDEEVERLWAEITSERDRAWFALMLRAGLRIGEVVDLEMSNILEQGHLGQAARLRVLGKGRKERMVWVTADAYAVLQAWLAVRPVNESQRVFLSERGNALTTAGISWLLKQYGQRAGLIVTPHQLRHTFARQVTEAGMPVTSLQKLLGHSQLGTTQVYTAGADPELVQAYQQAMTTLEAQPLPISASNAGQQTEVSRRQETIASPVIKPIKDLFAKWAKDLPPDIREACIALVNRNQTNWKPERRYDLAYKQLGALRRFWEWQIQHRPVHSFAELSLADLRAFQDTQLEAGNSASAANNATSLILKILHAQAENGLSVDASVFRLRPLSKAQTLPRYLSPEESQQLENWVKARLEDPDPIVRLVNACFFVLAHTGLRACECVELCFRDLDLARGRLWVRQGKNRRDRLVYLSKTAQLALQRYIGDQSYAPDMRIFRQLNGSPLYYGRLYRFIHDLGQAAGVPDVSPHRLRHTFATNFLNAGMKITHIQKLMGHEKLTTTMIYAQVLDSTLEADYRQAMRLIERDHTPLSNTPISAEGWPVLSNSNHVVNVQNP